MEKVCALLFYEDTPVGLCHEQLTVRGANRECCSRLLARVQTLDRRCHAVDLRAGRGPMAVNNIIRLHTP